MKVKCYPILGLTAKIGIFLSISLFIGLLLQGKASAAYTELPSQLPTLKYVNNNDPDPHQYVHLSVADDDYGSAVGDAGADLRTSYLKYYIQNSIKTGVRDISLSLVDRVRPAKYVCEHYKIHWRVIQTDANESPGSVLDSGDLNTNGNGCVGESTYSGYRFSFDSSSLVKSNIDGHKSLATAILRFSIVPDSGWATEPMSSTFTVQASGGRLGYLASSGTYQTTTYSTVDPTGSGGFGVNIYPSLSGTSETSSRPGPYGTDPGEVKPQHTISQKFGLPCSYSGPSSITVRFKDADRGTLTQDNNLNIQVLEYGPSGSLIDTVNKSPTWTNGSRVGSFSMNVQPGYNYRIDFNLVEGGNAIGLYYPFDSADFDLTCPSSATGSAACDNIAFTIPSGGNATRAYKVYIRPRADQPGAAGEAAMIAPGGTQIASSTSASGSTVTVKASDHYMAGYFEYVVLVYNGSNGTTGRDTNFDGDGSLYGDVGACYMASCTVTAGSALGVGKAIAGQPFNVNVTITADPRNINIIPPVRNIGGTNYALAGTLSLDGKWSPPDGDQWGGVLAPAYINDAPFGIAPGDSTERDFTETAPTGQGTHNVNMYPDYWLRGGIGGSCSGGANAITTYERYDFTASTSSSLLPDTESPATAQFNSAIIQQGVPVDGTSARSFTRDRGGAISALSFSGSDPQGNPHSTSFVNKNYTDNYSIPPGSYQMGDRYCVSILLDRGHGWRSGNSYLNEGPATANNCGPQVDNRPYVRAYGADVVAGGGFVNSTCGATASGIFAFMRPLNEQTVAGNRSGSGTQLAAMALGTVSGFTSASLRSTPPVSTVGNSLTFAHGTGLPNQTTMDAVLGGGMAAGDGWCAPDYYIDSQFSSDAKKPDGTNRVNYEVNNNPINIATLDDEEQTVKTPSSGKIRLLAPGGVPFSKHHAIFVDGDVFIRDNITYIASYPDVLAIPSFTLVVRGNIYIDNGVSQLDGMYIAQPYDRNNDGDYDDAGDGKGRIYTCARDNGGLDEPVIAPADLYNQCGANGPQPQLTVNGALIAQRVVFNRTKNSLRDSKYQEGPYMSSTSSAAEIINFSPEMFLSPPFFRATSTQTSGEFHYIATLPPIL